MADVSGLLVNTYNQVIGITVDLSTAFENIGESDPQSRYTIRPITDTSVSPGFSDFLSDDVADSTKSVAARLAALVNGIGSNFDFKSAYVKLPYDPASPSNPLNKRTV